MFYGRGAILIPAYISICANLYTITYKKESEYPVSSKHPD